MHMNDINQLINGKPILDACCGGRMFWFDKENPLVVFSDIRQDEFILCDGRPFKVEPDIIADFRNLPFPDGHFRLVVLDPPHLNKISATAWMAFMKLPKTGTNG